MSFLWRESSGLEVATGVVTYAQAFWTELADPPIQVAGIPGESWLDLLATLAGKDYRQEIFFDWFGSGATYFLLDANYGPYAHFGLAFARKWPPPLVWIMTGSPSPLPTVSTRHSGLAPTQAQPGSPVFRARLSQGKTSRRSAKFIHPFTDPATGKVVKRHLARVRVAFKKIQLEKPE